MNDVLDIVGGTLLVAGAVFMFLAGIGVIRFEDLYARMHSASKGPTLGLLLIALGAGLVLRTTAVVAALVLVVALQLLTAPVGSHMVGRSVHRRVRLDLDTVDDLARDERLDGHDAVTPAEPDDARLDTGGPDAATPGS
jgi:multicomponent Na+:H+ antiporter subunit G